MSLTYTFDIPAFRVSYPQFADEEKFLDATLSAFWDTATCYVANLNYGLLSGDCRYKALTLMTAHLTALSVIVANGGGYTGIPGIEQSAAIDKISVSTKPPETKSQFQWWLNTTPYGMQLLALLQVRGVGGLYIGGLPETLAFKKVGGFY